MSITNHKSCQGAPFSTGWFKPEVIFNQVLIIQHLSVDGGYQAIRKSEHMTRQILMFSFSVLPNYRWDFCQPEKCTDIIASELHCGKGERRLSGLPGQGYPAPPCQTGSPHPPWEAQGGLCGPRGRARLWFWGRGGPTPCTSSPGYSERWCCSYQGGTSSRRKSAKHEFLIHTYPWGAYIFHPLLGELQTPMPRHGLDHSAPT